MASLPTPPGFEIDPKADIVVRSIDRFDFPFRRLFLSAASPVFEDMLEHIDGLAGEKNAQGLPIMQVEERKDELELFLRFIHRDLARPKLIDLSNVDM